MQERKSYQKYADGDLTVDQLKSLASAPSCDDPRKTMPSFSEKTFEDCVSSR